ncbi:MAG: hypothetical protein V2I97_03935, partial [Desulfococcaceae bacterium]|nr:hypothetical protein [Desulfococcaceae bacterium]
GFFLKGDVTLHNNCEITCLFYFADPLKKQQTEKQQIGKFSEKCKNCISAWGDRELRLCRDTVSALRGSRKVISGKNEKECRTEGLAVSGG